MNVLDLLGQSFGRFYTAAVAQVPNLLAAIVVIGMALILRAILHGTAHVALTQKTRRQVLVARVAETTTVIVGVLLGLSMLGISVTGLLTGLGLVTLGLSFALQDLLVNFVAGLQLLGNAPFELGDEITVGEVRGRVRFVGSRTTVIDASDGSKVTVPNRDLLTKSVAVMHRPRRTVPR